MDEPLTLTRPDGVETIIPAECAWLLRRAAPKPRLIPVPNGRFEMIECRSKKKGESGIVKPRKKMLFDMVPDPDHQHQPVRVIFDGWAFWRDGEEILCEPIARARLRTLAEEAA